MDDASTEMERVDIFHVRPKTLTLRQKKLLEHLGPIYTKYDLFKRILMPLICNRGKPISLRLLDWVVTNFAKKYRIGYIHESELEPGIERHVNVYNSYQTNLDMFKRKNFDPFRRRARVFFFIDDVKYETTPGQLQFVLWAFKYGVIDYCIQRAEWLSRVMLKLLSDKKTHTIQNPLHGVYVYKYPRTLKLCF